MTYLEGKTMETLKARYIGDVTIKDPDHEDTAYELEVYEDPSVGEGAVFAVDASFFESGESCVNSPFNQGVLLECDGK